MRLEIPSRLPNVFAVNKLDIEDNFRTAQEQTETPGAIQEQGRSKERSMLK